MGPGLRGGKVQCKHCLHEFFGGASRIRDLLVHTAPSCGIVKILSLSATASRCEQKWSSFGYVHSDSCNRLITRHATDLVWLYSNLALAKRTQSLEQQDMA